MSLQENEHYGDGNRHDAGLPGAAPACVHLDNGRTVVSAWPDKFRVSRVSVGAVRKERQALDSNDVEVVGRLLSGCIVAALPDDASAKELPEESECAAKERKLRDHVFELCGNYEAMRFTKVTVSRARAQFEEIGDARSAEFCSLVLREEAGHDKIALVDLKNMGLPAKELVARFVPRQPSRVVQLLIDYSKNGSPYGIFGYGYAVERLSLTNSEADVMAVKRLAPDGVEIARCLEIHSSAGEEVEHLRNLLDFVAGLDSDQKKKVCDAVFHTVSVNADNKTHQEDRQLLDAILDEWQWKPFVGVNRRV